MDTIELCGVLDEYGKQCSRPARFWVGSNGIDNYVHVCGDHVEDVKQDEDVVYSLPVE